MLQRYRPWPPDYTAHIQWRQQQVLRIRQSPELILGARQYYQTRPVEFINDWCYTYDPRNAVGDIPSTLPFIQFKRQKEMVEFLHACVKAEENGLIEKARDMGATWTCVAFSVWLWMFWPGASIGWGSRKADLVDRIGDMDSIFEKIRFTIDLLPPELLPVGYRADTHASHMRLINPETNASITGESGDNIGRGGRKLIYFKDESAHYEHPEKIEAALTDNTRVQIDISSVNGLGNVFHRRREAGVDWEPGQPITKGRTAVFIMDWREHPSKTDAWHAERRQKAEADGLLHIFYQEIERNYSASVEGVIIPAEWVLSAIDAQEKIPGMEQGGWCGGLDVADEGGDRNALAQRKGLVLAYLEEWGERDTGVTARRAVEACRTTTPIEVQYDCIGVGAGVKAETNRLSDERDRRGKPLMPKGIRFVPWNAGAGVINPEKHVNPKDKDSPLNEDFYGNLKAQGWWELRRRFEKTHKAITEGAKYPVDELIALPSDLPKLRQLQKELSQPVAIKSSRMKLIVDKMPEGVRSPNLADAVMMCYFPVTLKHYDSTMSWIE